MNKNIFEKEMLGDISFLKENMNLIFSELENGAGSGKLLIKQFHNSVSKMKKELKGILKRRGLK